MQNTAQMVLKPNFRTIFNAIVGAILLILLVYKVKEMNLNLEKVAPIFQEINYLYFFAAVVLVIPNYFIESFKWNMLGSILEERSLQKSTSEVLQGLRFGLFTPFMLGDFVGRSLGFSSENRGSIVALNFFNRITQTWTALSLGSVALWLWYITSRQAFLLLPSIILTIFTLISLGLLYFTPYNLLRKWKLFAPFELPNKVKTAIITLSMLRSLVYNLQYVFFYLAFGIVLDTVVYFIGVNIILLVKTIGGGLNVLGDLSIRELVSVNFFSRYDVDMLLILLATFTVWFINIFSPALFGLLLSKSK